MKNFNRLPNARTKIALWGTLATLAVTGAGCGENKKDNPENQLAVPPTVKAPDTVNQKLQCSDKSYTAEQGELIRIKLDDGYQIDVVNAGVVKDISTAEEGDRSHLFTASLVDHQLKQAVGFGMGNFETAVNFDSYYPALGRTVNMYRVTMDPVPADTQEAAISVCSRSPIDMEASWEHVRDDAFQVISPPAPSEATQTPPPSSI